MSGTLDPDSKGIMGSPSNEIHVKTRLSWLPEFKDTNKLEGYGEWPTGWQ
jgi:hypothetical protein